VINGGARRCREGLAQKLADKHGYVSMTLALDFPLHREDGKDAANPLFVARPMLRLSFIVMLWIHFLESY